MSDLRGLGLLGPGKVRCSICGDRRAVIGWCDPCRVSYYRARNGDDGTILAGLLWAAERARRFERKRARQRR